MIDLEKAIRKIQPSSFLTFSASIALRRDPVKDKSTCAFLSFIFTTKIEASLVTNLIKALI